MKGALTLSSLLSVLTVAVAVTDRTKISVGFEFQLEVEDKSRAGSTSSILELIDAGILGDLQQALPNGQVQEGEDLANVEFTGIESEIFSACFTDNDECSLVRSTISVSYEGQKPEQSVEFVTLRLVQDYFKSLTEEDNQISISYAYPSIVWTLAQLQLQTVKGSMTSTEIKVMEDTFVEVFGAIVFAMEGDTDIVDVKFLYQDLFGHADDVSGGKYTLSSDLQIAGFCRDCTSSDFTSIVADVVTKNLPAFHDKLKLNSNSVDSHYFDEVVEVTFSEPELPNNLPPIEDESLFDDTPPSADNKQPWFLWFGIGVAMLVIGLGVLIVVKDHADFDKEGAFSTSDSEEDDSEYLSSDEEEGERDIEGDAEETMEGTYADQEEDLDEDQVETVANTEGGNSNYEVFVY